MEGAGKTELIHKVIRMCFKGRHRQNIGKKQGKPVELPTFRLLKEKRGENQRKQYQDWYPDQQKKSVLHRILKNLVSQNKPEIHQADKRAARAPYPSC